MDVTLLARCIEILMGFGVETTFERAEGVGV